MGTIEITVFVIVVLKTLESNPLNIATSKSMSIWEVGDLEDCQGISKFT